MIRVGLVGYGFMGKMHAQSYAATGEAQLVSVVDKSEDGKADASAKFGSKAFDSIEALLNGPEVDVVDICSPTHLHEEQALMAISAGKDVIIEKPFALTAESCERVIAESKKTGAKIMVAHVVRFWPESILLKEILDSGRLGKPLWAFAKRLASSPNWAWQDWMKNPKLSGGPILDIHIHDLDFLASVLGRPKRLVSCGTTPVNGAWGSALTMCFDHSGGAHSQSEGSEAMPDGFPWTSEMLFVCEKGSIACNLTASPTLIVRPVGEKDEHPEVPTLHPNADVGGNVSSLGGYYNEILYFLSCIRESKQPEKITPEEAAYAVKMCQAVKESADTGEIVTLK